MYHPLRGKIPVIIFFLLICARPVSGQSSIQSSQISQFGQDINAIPLEDKTIVTWNNNRVFLNEVPVYTSNGEYIFYLIRNDSFTHPLVLILTSEEENEHIFHIRIINEEGESISNWPIKLEDDMGLPSFHFIGETLLMLYPVTQSYKVYHTTGGLISQESLFNKNDHDHEKKLFFQQSLNGNEFILGMKSASLKTKNNTSVFRITNGPELMAELPITIPYHFSISDEDIIAVVGTKTQPDSYKQIPFLIFLDKNQTIIHQPIALEKIPQKIIWHKESLFLLYRNHLLKANPQDQSLPEKIEFDSNLFPIHAFTTVKSIFIVSGNGIGLGRNGNYYQSIELAEFNVNTSSFFTHSLSDGPISEVKFFPASTKNAFYLKLDSQLVRFIITK